MVPPVFVVISLLLAGATAAAKLPGQTAAAKLPGPTAAAKLPGPTAATPLIGNFAGEGVALRVVPTGVVIQGNCASGKIPIKVRVDRNGRFVANGYFNRYHPVIRLSDLAPIDTQARFAGELTGNVLILTIAIAGKPTQRHRMVRDAPTKFATCK